jgi:hypothetical protein
MNRDLVVGIVGALVLVAGMVGVFVYERNVAIASGLGQNGAAGGANVTIPSLSGSLAVGKTDDKMVNVTNASGVTNLTFHLTWKATMGQDTLKILVKPPVGGGVTEGANPPQSSSGDITATVAVPAGVDPSGTWDVQVTFVSADAGTPVPPPVPVPGTTDSSVSYNVAIAAK